MRWRPQYDLPESMAVVAQAIGHSATLSLIHVYGGTRVWIPLPRDLDSSHPLVRFLGAPCVLSLSKRIGGSRLEIPVGRTLTAQARDERVFLRWVGGTPIGVIANEMGLSRRTVHEIVVRVRARRTRQDVEALPPP